METRTHPEAAARIHCALTPLQFRPAHHHGHGPFKLFAKRRPEAPPRAMLESLQEPAAQSVATP